MTGFSYSSSVGGPKERIIGSTKASIAAGGTLRFSLVGHDRPEIERRVATTLGGLNVGVETFDTRLGPEPHSGSQLFFLEAQLWLPAKLQASDVQASLEGISPEIMVDVLLKPASDDVGRKSAKRWDVP